MSTLTTNYKLIKPDYTDIIDVNNFNDNADILDKTLFNKVDKVSGKGLSTNDYTDEDKSTVATVVNKVDKIEGKGLSSNDYTDEDKLKLNSLELHPKTHLASMIVFADGETLQDKFNKNTLFTPSTESKG